MTHSELCKLACDWLKRSASRGGHGCKVAIDECRTGWSGEVPDAIGFRYTGAVNSLEDGTVLVECKVSRSDFLADANKPHRIAGGVGNWRYYMAPEGVIRLDDVPQKWGLIEVNARGHIKLLRGVYSDTNYLKRRERLVAMRHESETSRELFLLVRMFDRIEDPEKLVEIVKERNRLLAKLNNNQECELQTERSKAFELTWKVQEMTEELGRYRNLHGVLPKTTALVRQVSAKPTPH